MIYEERHFFASFFETLLFCAQGFSKFTIKQLKISFGASSNFTEKNRGILCAWDS
jgi:hypothetical protein